VKGYTDRDVVQRVGWCLVIGDSIVMRVVMVQWCGGVVVWCWLQVSDAVTGYTLIPCTTVATSGRKLGVCLRVRRPKVDLVAKWT